MPIALWGLASLLFVLVFSRWFVHDQLPLVEQDSGMFFYIGQQVWRGAVLYRDIWDHKPPLIYWINALAYALTPGSPLGLLVISTGTVAAYIALLVIALRRIANATLLAIAAILVIATAAFLAGNPNSVEMYSLPLQAVCLMLIVGERRTWHAAAVGVVAALLFLLRPNNAGSAIIALAMLLWECRADVRLLLRTCFSAVAGFLVVMGIALIPFLANHTLPQLLEATLVFNAHYVAVTKLSHRFRALSFGLLAAPYLLAVPIAVGGAICGISSTRESLRRLSWITLAWLALELMLAASSGRTYGHYFLLCLTPIVLGVVITGELLNSASLEYTWLRRLPAAVAIVPILLVGMTSLQDTLWNRKMPDANLWILQIVGPELGPSDRFCTWGDVPGNDLWYRVGARPASRIFSTIPLQHDVSLYRAYAGEVLNAIQQNRPLYILEDTSFAGLFGGADRQRWDTPQLQSQKRDLSRMYGAVANQDGFVLYRRRTGPARPAPGGD